jgi:signal transduction histidine kinase/DNA-binding response OmpR family regulator/ligand-binding sensor domain-containing protein
MMWIATQSGVVSFDGYNFRHFNPEKYNLSASNIVRLAEDIHGNIWIIGVRKNSIVIDVMNPKTELVIPLHEYTGQAHTIEIPLRENIVVLHNIAGKIWVGTNDAGYLYDGEWHQVYHPVKRKRILDVWWPAKNGFWSISPNTKFVFLENSDGVTLDSFPRRKHLLINDNLDLWISSPDDNLLYHQLQAVSGKINAVSHRDLPAFKWINERLCPSDYLSLQRYGYEWTSKPAALFLSRRDGSGRINLCRQFPDISNIGEFCVDRQGGIWTSSKNKIIRLTEKRPTGFQTFLCDESQDRSTRGMIQVGRQLYVHSYKGDCRINLDNGSISPFNLMGGQGLAFLPDALGFWTGGHGGKLKYIEPGKTAVEYTFDRRSDINVFLRYGNGIMIGNGNGLFKINREKHTVEPLPLQHTSIEYLYSNNRGIWACTGDGLYLLNEEGQVLGHYLQPGTDLKYERLTCLYEDENGYFWIATRGSGLIQWSVEKGIIRHLTESDGLSNNDVHAVYPDNSNCLWLPSNYGLMRLHRPSGRIQVFFKRDGIADSEFNSLSHYRAPDGRFFFGGVNGITAFYPEDIPFQEPRTPELRLVEAHTFQLKSGEFVNHLPEVDAGKPVIITPNDDYLDIRVSPLVYEEVNRIRYSWKIEGYSDNWIQQQSPLIRLHNLPYGKYQLHIRYTMQGNIWSEHELIIPVISERPFYLDWPFLLALFVGMTGIAWFSGNRRALQLHKANLRLEQEVQNRTRRIESDKQLIEQQARELRSLDEAKSQFFTNITHELRTPLTLILGPADQIIQTKPTHEKTMEYAQTIRRNASRLLNLIEELLDLSRMDTNKISVLEKPVRFYPFLSGLIASFAPYAEHRGVELSLLYNCPREITLMMDNRKWEKIINNLLNNAIKFTPGGGSVIVSAEIADDELLITVQDTGMGIMPEDLPYIFDRYYQSHADGVSYQGGSGIGLALCREYIRLLGGEITVKSTPGRGSSFMLRCPLLVAEKPEAAEYAEQTEQTAVVPMGVTAASSPEKRTLLLVEDDREMSEYIQNILNTEYNLLTAENGKRALEVLAQNRADLIISDVMMPEMDGFQLLKAVRERYADIPFIMLTARSEPTDRLSALRLGVDDYLTKPFLAEELTTRIVNLLKRFNIRQKAAENPGKPGIDSAYDQQWIARLGQVIEDHISNTDLSVETLADALHISRRSLFYKLRASTGMTPNQYIVEIRLNKARQLLESRQFETVSEVCYAVGFKTPHYFSKLMKERFG